MRTIDYLFRSLTLGWLLVVAAGGALVHGLALLTGHRLGPLLNSPPFMLASICIMLAGALFLIWALPRRVIPVERRGGVLSVWVTSLMLWAGILGCSLLSDWTGTDIPALASEPGILVMLAIATFGGSAVIWRCLHRSNTWAGTSGAGAQP